MIREYTDSDLHQLLAVWEAASAAGHPFLSEEFMERERKLIAEVYIPNAKTWVCEIEGRVAGFISLLGNEVGALFIAPEHSRRGVGWALMDHARELRGDLEVEVFKANDIGRAFHARYGFELKEEKIHDETGLELLRLELRKKAGT